VLDTILISFYQFVENAKSSGIQFSIQKALYINHEVVPVVKDLQTVSPVFETLVKQNINFIEVTQETLPRFNFSYRFKSRLLKAKRNINNGYKSFAVVSGYFVVGDVWYVTSETSKHSHLHNDVDLLFIVPGEKDVYLFDMFVDPINRGKNIAAPMMNYALFRLAERGYIKAFGYFEARNIPALWVHRMLQFEELDRILVSRYFFARSSRKILKTNS
jgi:GNAT superfamily N-acetyltransferase